MTVGGRGQPRHDRLRPGRRPLRAHRRGAPRRRAGGAAGVRRHPAGRRRAAGGGHHGASGHARTWPAAAAAVRARPLREPASLLRSARLDRRRCRLRGHPGEHRGHLRRRGRVPPQGDAARGGHPGLGQHPYGRRALRPLRLRAGPAPGGPQAHAGPQDQRPDLRRGPLAADGRPGGRRVPRRGARLQPRRRRLHLPGGAAEPVRRHRHRQPLRGHPDRPGRRGQRRDRVRRLGQPQPGPYRTVALRAGARSGARHRRARASPTRWPPSTRPP